MSIEKIINEIVPVPNGELYVEKIGTGMPLVLIHAGFSDRRDWTHQFKDFGNKYLTIAYDQRGSGNSSTITTAFSPTDDLKAVTEHLKIEKVFLVGHSLGGTIALDFALQYPDKVSALVLIATGMNGYTWSDEYLESTKEIWRNLEPETMTKLFLSAYFYNIGMSDSKIKSEIHKITTENFEKVLTWKTFDIKDVHSYFPEPIIKLKNLKMPTLVIYGDRDSNDIKQIAHILNKNIQNVKTSMIKNTDHLLNFEKPDELNKLVLNFLSDLEKISSKTNLVSSNSLRLWTQEFFNELSRSVCILIAGAGAPAMFWTDAFCEKLVKAGYSVIRFDHRDQGLSDAVDWEKNPYTIEDIAKDVINILNAYGIKKAHIIGHSMGGMVAQWLAYTCPQRIISYTSISVATCGITGQPPKKVMDILMENQPTQNFENDLYGFMRSWKVLNGNYEIDSQIAKKYTEDFYIRSKHTVGVAWHHIRCQQNYIDLRDKIKQITSPGLFIHGELDPLIPVNGAVETQKIVPNSRLMIIPGMGHMIFNRVLEDTICMALIEHFKVSEA